MNPDECIRVMQQKHVSSLEESIENAKKVLTEAIKKDSSMTANQREWLKVIRADFRKYKKIAEKYSKGNITGALTDMRKLLFPEPGKMLMDICEFNKRDGLLYRARSSKEYHIYSREEMFHVPFDCCSVIGCQRYSISGFPCLYLGASLYSCWEEIRRADLERLNYVGFKYIKSRPLRFLLIDRPARIEQFEDIRRLSLCMLCTYYVDNDGKNHKFEYVMPELVLHAQISANNDLDGIAYVSSRFYQPGCLYPYDHARMMNYVIPTKIREDGKYCRVLRSMFTVSEVNALFNWKVRGVPTGMSRVRPTEYERSLFYRLEKGIMESEFEKIEETNK